MKEKYYKYAMLLLERGLCINKEEPLVMNATLESIDFIRALTEAACSLGVNDIYFDWYDDELKHSELKYYDEESIKNSRFWNKSIHDEYAKKGAAFLFLTSYNPGIMDDIPSSKLKMASNESLYTRQIYREMQSNNEVDWCIASVATDNWGKLLFPNSNTPKEDLWDLIFDICLINEDNPLIAWDNKMKNNKEMCLKLNDLNIKTLHYQNSLGTDLIIELTNHAIWCGGSSKIKGREPIVNIPTEEVFTTPDKSKTHGIVYTSLPLIHSGVKIENICLEFKDGKVINYQASSGLEELKNILETDEESNMLGECALVDKNSKIAMSNTLFYETLFDENASCHIALGRGFKECLPNGENLTTEELEKVGYNKSKNHVDIMIGTKDLNIIATTYDNKEIQIFKDGSFNI